MLTSAKAAEGDWLVARVQEAGRGRQGREWHALRGNFFGSTIVQLRYDDPPAPTLSLVSGLALVEAVDAALPDQPLMLKWPNDLLLSGKKLAGILLERSGDRVIAGFGVNLAFAPHLQDRETASLGAKVSAEAFAPLLAASFARSLEMWRSTGPRAVQKAWLMRAHPVGTLIRVHGSASERIAGAFAGLEIDGALRLQLPSGEVEIVRAGDVEL